MGFLTPAKVIDTVSVTNFPDVRATVTHGIVSKVVTDQKNQAVMIETSCDIHTGASGGMIVRAGSGSFLGLITQNTVQTDGVVLPKLNGSLPGSFLGRFLSAFLESGGSASGL